MSAFKIIITLVSVFVSVSGGYTNSCRCEDENEDLYFRRLSEHHSENRELSYYFQSGNVRMDSSGYYVVDGVRVIPSYESPCNGGRRLSEEDRVPADQSSRQLPFYGKGGMMGGMMGKGMMGGMMGGMMSKGGYGKGKGKGGYGYMGGKGKGYRYSRRGKGKGGASGCNPFSGCPVCPGCDPYARSSDPDACPSGCYPTEVFPCDEGPEPAPAPVPAPVADPTNSPTAQPVANIIPATLAPTKSAAPSAAPTKAPSAEPTNSPSAAPTNSPSATPTGGPTKAPSAMPSGAPTPGPTANPTTSPSAEPSASPAPSSTPTLVPTANIVDLPDEQPQQPRGKGLSGFFMRDRPRRRSVLL